uniref:Uncharacterized protein n=1 Tax=Anguilla anguilla TaxID=7936 RepID=A0A0E9RLU1_ANGAN
MVHKEGCKSVAKTTIQGMICACTGYVLRKFICGIQAGHRYSS